MIVTVQKRDLEHLMGCMERLEAFTPPGGGWSAGSVLALAGLCLHELMRRGIHQAGLGDRPDVLIEHTEHAANLLRRRLLGVVQFAAGLVSNLSTESYDEQFEDVIEFQVGEDGEGMIVFKARRGFRGKHRDQAWFYEL